jgi:hypothetical protein
MTMTDDMDATQPEAAPHVDPADDAGRDFPMTAGPDGAPAVTQAQANAPSLAAASPDASPAAPAATLAGKVIEPGWTPSGAKVTLAPVPPMGSLTLPPLEGGGEGIVIEVDGTEVDADAAQRALKVATEAGFRLQEL